MKADRTERDTTWTNPFGKRKNVRDHYRELVLKLRDGSRPFEVVLRAFDDGIAFWYVLQANGSAREARPRRRAD